MWAVARRQLAMVELLASKGANVNARSTIRDYQRVVTAESRAKSLERGGFTPLLYAARENCRQCIDILLKHKADVDLGDPRGVRVLCDGNEIQEMKKADYLTRYVPYKYTKGIGQDGLPIYSFQLDQKATQPSGSLNASRIRNFQVEVDVFPLPTNPTYTYDLNIYVENINFLEIVSGMGGLKYAL
jgi:hypothetical protein